MTTRVASSMRTVDGVLSKRAQQIYPDALVFREEDGTYTLERKDVISLGDSFGRAQSALEMLKRAKEAGEERAMLNAEFQKTEDAIKRLERGEL
jgi:hypothetical protein